jgi:DNA-binding transcriptional MocR family regulator
MDGQADYAALADRIRLLVIDGRVTSGTRLPSERDLSTRLGVSRTTVNSAYADLRASGYLLSRQGSGSVVTLPGRPGDLPVPGASDSIDLSRATSASVPGLHAAGVRALERLPSRLTTDGYELDGLPELRASIAARYSRRGLPTDSDQVLVTSGSQSAISLIARTLVGRRDRIIVEAPGYPHANDALRGSGARLFAVPVDPVHGWDVAEFEQVARRERASLAYLMPDFHNPTSRSMSMEARARIVRIAENAGVTIVADETTAELDIDRGAALPPLAAFEARPGTVISVGSASKTVWGGLRIGWIRGAREHIDRLVAARFANDLGAAVIDQLVMSEMLDEFDEVLAYRTDVHRRSRDALVAALPNLPGATMAHIEGGVAAWVKLGAPYSSALTIACRARGLLIGAGPWFGVGGEFERFIRVPITADPDVLSRAVGIMAEAWQGLTPGRSRSAPTPIDLL